MALAAPSGCGGDDEPAGTPKAPELTVPQTSPELTETAPTTTTSPSTSTSTVGDGGGATSPSTQTDTPENDVNPSPTTPEGRFERFCEENPGACG